MDNPRTEMELVAKFLLSAKDAGFEIVKIQQRFPDAIVKKDGSEYRVEFEYNSSNFRHHGHDPSKCDLIICWIDDDDCPVLPIIALSDSSWTDAPIRLVTQEQKTAWYWKSRALDAEEKLNREDRMIKEQMTDLIGKRRREKRKRLLDREVRTLELLVKDGLFISLVRDDGLSINDACLLAYGRERGGNLVKKTKRLLSLNSIDIQLREIKQQIGIEKFDRIHGEIVSSLTEATDEEMITWNQKKNSDGIIKIRRKFEANEKDQLFISLVRNNGLGINQACKQAYGRECAGNLSKKTKILLKA